MKKLKELKDHSESEWEDIFSSKSLEYEGTAAKIKSIATHLRQTFPDDEVQIQVQFETFSLLQKFEKKLELEYEIYRPEQVIVEKNDWDTVWKEASQESRLKKKVPGIEVMKIYKIMFGNPLECIVFYHHYAKKLKKLETEYNYIIIPYRIKIGVYLKDSHNQKISSFFVTELFEMKKKFRMKVETNPEIYKKARYSKVALEKLEKVNIRTMILSRYESAVFYSQHYESSFDIIKQVNNILAYHTSLIKFPDQFVNKYILKEIMRLIYFQIKPALNQIESYYDMPVEVDIEKAVILITNFHEVFSDGVDLVKESLQKLKIIEIQCEDLIQMKKIMLKAQYLPLVKFNYRYRRCFLLFSDSVIQKNTKVIHKFCNQISSFFKGKYRVTIHFTHLFQGQDKLVQQTERASAIAGEYQLNNIFHSTFLMYSHFDKITFEPVELSIYTEDIRKKQIEMFFFDFITNRKAQIKKFNYNVLQSIDLDQSLFHQSIQQSVILPLAEGKNSKISQSRNSLKDLTENQMTAKKQARSSTFDTIKKDKSEFFQLSLPFEYPQTSQYEEKDPIKLGKRNRNLQALMETEFKRKLRAWKIIVHIRIGLPSMKCYDRIEIINSEIFEIKNSYYKLKAYSKISSKKVSQFKEGEKGYICFVNREKNMFIPIYKVEFISE